MVRSLEIIGEASKKIYPASKMKYPLIDWFKISGLRNRLIHEYFGIDYDIVRQILESEITPLKESIEIIIKKKQHRTNSLPNLVTFRLALPILLQPFT